MTSVMFLFSLERSPLNIVHVFFQHQRKEGEINCGDSLFPISITNHRPMVRVRPLLRICCTIGAKPRHWNALEQVLEACSRFFPSTYHLRFIADIGSLIWKACLVPRKIPWLSLALFLSFSFADSCVWASLECATVFEKGPYHQSVTRQDPRNRHPVPDEEVNNMPCKRKEFGKNTSFHVPLFHRIIKSQIEVSRGVGPLH